MLSLTAQVDMNTQGSSHWDGLRHYPYQSTLQYYNGVTQASISGPEANTAIGVQSKPGDLTSGKENPLATMLSMKGS
jgi:hypothetical protein